MFGEYCDDELVKVVYSLSGGVYRMDFVFWQVFRKQH